MNRRILITGCSSGGKSTLIAALSYLGHTTVAEPGRRIVDRENKIDGSALPWVNFEKFAQQAFETAHQDFMDAKDLQHDVFFDRGLIDAAVALKLATGTPLVKTLRNVPRYDVNVFIAPPWPEIFEQDENRPQDFTSAVDEFNRISSALIELGYNSVTLPKAKVQDRAAFILDYLKR